MRVNSVGWDTVKNVLCNRQEIELRYIVTALVVTRWI